MPPLFIWHNRYDKFGPAINPVMFAGKMIEYGRPFELHIFPNGPHGLGLAPEFPEVAQWAPMCQRWLLAQGFGKEA